MKTVEDNFKVVAVSSNTNSFGLTGIVAVSKAGEAFQFGYNNSLNPVKRGDIVSLSFPIPQKSFFYFRNKGESLPILMNGNTIEIPEVLPAPPDDVLKELFSGIVTIAPQIL